LPIRRTYNAKISREKKEFNLRIYQGEHMIAKNNKFLFDSTYYLTNSMTKKESAEIEVLFDVDSFGILTVHVQLIIFVYGRQIRKESLSNHSPIYKYFIVCGALIAIFTILFYIKNK
jgi:molecular chaperone DnaK (HSP70)